MIGTNASISAKLGFDPCIGCVCEAAYGFYSWGANARTHAHTHTRTHTHAHLDAWKFLPEGNI